MEIEIKKAKCPSCGKEFEASARSLFIGRDGKQGFMCRDCFEKKRSLIDLERKLLAEEFAIEQEDTKLATQINGFLTKESSSGINEQDEIALNMLTQKLLQDEKRRKKIVKEIVKLQKKRN